MKNLDYQGLVEQFMETAGQTVNKTPTELTTEQAAFRYELLREELQELRDAVEHNDKTEILDALGDSIYILAGTAATMGVNISDTLNKKFNDFKHMFKEPRDKSHALNLLTVTESRSVTDVHYVAEHIAVLAIELCVKPATLQTAFCRIHLSNMSKFCKTEQEAKDSIAEYAAKNIEVVTVKRGEFWVLYRASDNKVLKSINYSPVFLEDLV